LSELTRVTWKIPLCCVGKREKKKGVGQKEIGGGVRVREGAHKNKTEVSVSREVVTRRRGEQNAVSGKLHNVTMANGRKKYGERWQLTKSRLGKRGRRKTVGSLIKGPTRGDT